MKKRKATAIWNGTGKEGSGTISTHSGVLKQTPYSFNMRFGEDPGTNPEELISAALCSCYTMKLAFMLNAANLTAEEITTNSIYQLENKDGQWVPLGIHLEVSAKVPGADEGTFKELAIKAKSECPISKILNLNITVESKLIS